MARLPFFFFGVALAGIAAPVVAVGCSSVDVELHDDVLFESGTRLRARVFDGGDGAVLFRGWFDTDLGVDCGQRRATDGADRCLPAVQPGFGFLDAACTEPVIALDACAGPAPKFVTKADAPTEQCAPAPPAVAYEVGAPVTPDAVYFLDVATGTCLSGPLGDGPYFRRGAVVPPEKFAALEIVDEPVDGALEERLARRIERSDDGAWRGITIVDREKNAPCNDYLWTYEGAYGDVCVAGTTLLLTQSYHQYTDAACTVDANVVELAPPAQTCGLVFDTVLDFAFDDDECGVHYDVRKLGPTTSPTVPLYGGPPSKCAPAVPPQPGNALYGIDEVIAPASFPPLPVRRAGSGALRVPVWTDVDDHGLVSLGGFEREGERSCFFYELGGALRCVDPMGVDVPHFSDAGCTQPVVVVYVGDGTCPVAPQTMAAIIDQDAACGLFQRLAEVVTLGDVLPAATSYYDHHPDGTCTLVPLSPGAELRLVGATVDPSTFPVVVERTE